MRLRIEASIAFLFRACFTGVLGTISPLPRLSFLGDLGSGGGELLPVWMRDSETGPPNRTPYRRGGPTAVEGVKQRWHSIQQIQVAAKPIWARRSHLLREDKTECTKLAHRHSLAIFHRRLGYRREFRNGSEFCPLLSPRKLPFASEF